MLDDGGLERNRPHFLLYWWHDRPCLQYDDIWKLKEHHQPRAQNIVRARGRSSQAYRPIVDLTMDVVELQTRVRIPPPVHPEAQALAFPAEDVLIIEIRIGIPNTYL